MKDSTRYRIIGILRWLGCRLLPIMLWMTVIFGFDAPYMAVLTVLCALIHECGHIGASMLIGGRAKARTDITGFRIKCSGVRGYKEQISILAAGPTANIAMYLISIPLQDSLCGYIKIFGLLNLATAISNLLPIEQYDGYGIVNEWLTMKQNDRGKCVLEAISFSFTALMTFLSLYIIAALNSGYWIFCLFFASMLSKMVKLSKYDNFKEKQRKTKHFKEF